MLASTLTALPRGIASQACLIAASSSPHPPILIAIKPAFVWLLWLLVLVGAGLVLAFYVSARRLRKAGTQELLPKASHSPQEDEDGPASRILGTSARDTAGDRPNLAVPAQSQAGEPAEGTQDAGRHTGPPLDTEPIATSPQPGSLSWWRAFLAGYWLEWLLVFLAVTLFCAGILDLNAPTRLPGNESEVFQMLDWTLVNSLQHYHAFPLWNIYIQTGLPFIADPMLHIYNPVVTLPVLIFGVQVGFKLGVYFSFLIAALGMWRLALVLGMGKATRLWMALMFAFAGQPVARFFQGQYLFVFGYAFIPWVISSLILVARTRRKRDIALAVASLALIFFSGNAYYSLYILFVVAALLLSILFGFKKKLPFISLDTRLAVIFLGVGLLAVGLVAIQLLPTAEFWPRLSKDLHLAGSQTLEQIFLDYTSRDSMRPDAYTVLPAREEFYAYIGLAPFLALALLPLAVWKRDRRMILFFLLVLMLALAWISLPWMPWKESFLNTRFFLQFRHLLRILVFGSFALICLAGLGIDTLWKSLSDHLSKANRLPWLNGLKITGLLALSVFMLYGVVDVFNTNSAIVQSQEIYQPGYHVMSWLRKNDLNDFYVRHNPTNAWQAAILSNNLRFLDAWYHFSDIRLMDGKINERFVQALPNYLTQSIADPLPENALLINNVEGYAIFSLPQSLPMAFLVDNDQLRLGGEAGPLLRSQVTPLNPFISTPNNLELIAEGQSGQTLVIMMTLYPGWQVKLDGQSQPLLNVSGYMAVAAQLGVHKYSFKYTPNLFFIGLVISLVSAAIVIGLFVTDVRFSLKSYKAGLFALWESLRRMPKKWHGRVRKPGPVTGNVVYRQGVLHPGQPLPLPDDTTLNVVVDPWAGSNPLKLSLRRWLWATGNLANSFWRAIPLEIALFTLATSIYLATRLVGLANFPIYFFTDEAVQTVMAEDFVHNGLRNYDGELLPTYFSKDPTYNLSSVSVYAQVIPYLLFGKSVFVTRLVSVLIGTLGALAVGLILRDIFKLRYWWSAVLLLSIAPAWFLHSRTAFETVEMTAFYAGFLYFYLRYRYISPRSLYPALLMGALVFYTYSPGQLIIVLTGVFLFFSDLRYHWQNRKTALRGLFVLIILALPYLRYSLAHPASLLAHLSTRAPYWLENIPFSQKIGHYFSDYFYGLNPQYWFFPNQHDLARHLMKGYGHLLLATLPLFTLGLLIILSKLRSSAHRAVFFAMLAAPSGSALVGIGITRVLVFVIPAVLLMALGLEQLLVWLDKGIRRLFQGTGRLLQGSWVNISFSLLLVLLLGGVNIAMLRDALVNGPTWYEDYTLAGMQYGASQLFTAVNQYLDEHPGTEALVTPNWTNGADAVAGFFLPPGAPVRLGSVEGHIFRHLELNDKLLFVMMPAELEKVVSSGKFKNVRVEQVLPYPNGVPGFYFARLQYVDNIDQILAAEQQQRSVLQEGTMAIQGQPVHVGYSMLDMGSIELLFDGDQNTVARTLEANPFVVELTFPRQESFSGYRMVLGSADVSVTLIMTAETGQAYQSVANFTGSVSNPVLDVKFDQPVNALILHFEILQPYSGVPANVHVWEIELK